LTLEKLKEETGWPGFSGLASWETTGWVVAWYLLSLVLGRVLPGEHREGNELASGGRLKYKFNSTYNLFTLSTA
jgi:delta14-sterol reductase